MAVPRASVARRRRDARIARESSAARAISDGCPCRCCKIEPGGHQPVSERALRGQHPDLPRERKLVIVNVVAGYPTILYIDQIHAAQIDGASSWLDAHVGSSRERARDVPADGHPLASGFASGTSSASSRQSRRSTSSPMRNLRSSRARRTWK